MKAMPSGTKGALTGSLKCLINNNRKMNCYFKKYTLFLFSNTGEMGKRGSHGFKENP